MRLGLIPLCLAASLLATPQAYATTIVDTGPGPISSGGTSLYSPQWLAAEFSVTEAVTISSIEGWMSVYEAGTLDIAIYADGGEIPGSELFRASGSLGPLTPATWRGFSGLSWDLLADTYWVAFEVMSSSSFRGSMAWPSQAPLGNEAFRCFGGPQCAGYKPVDSLDLGVRIEGTVFGVPEPASSFALLSLGLASLGAFGLRRRRNS